MRDSRMADSISESLRMAPYPVSRFDVLDPQSIMPSSDSLEHSRAIALMDLCCNEGLHGNFPSESLDA